MKVYSYRIDHDFGLAPNPFGQYCTLVVCKPRIRKSSNLAVGDWIIGTGSKALEKLTSKKLTNSLIYAMKVTECIRMECYWADKRFQYKKPNMNGSLINMFGDNFYKKDIDDEWTQIDCAHRNRDGTINQKHFETDLSGKNALISDTFYYFGDNAKIIPSEFLGAIHKNRGEKIVRPSELGVAFINWIESNFSVGIHGDPLNWILYKQIRLF